MNEQLSKEQLRTRTKQFALRVMRLVDALLKSRHLAVEVASLGFKEGFVYFFQVYLLAFTLDCSGDIMLPMGRTH